jgi:hypothetical protein
MSCPVVQRIERRFLFSLSGRRPGLFILSDPVSLSETVIAPVIERLKSWREANNLSRSQAVEVLKSSGLPAKLKTLQARESGRNSPQPITAAALERFLDERPG